MKAAIILPVLALFSAGCAAFRFSSRSSVICFRDYFPLKEGKRAVYKVTRVTGNGVIDYPPDSCIYRTHMAGKKDVFYVDDLPEGANSIIGSNVFCRGAFYFEGNTFYVSPLFWKRDLVKCDPGHSEILFPAKTRLHHTYGYKDGEETLRYTFIGYENLVIKWRPFNDCLKLLIIQDWPSARYADTVWFHKKTGLVKWYRSTGRTEEIDL